MIDTGIFNEDKYFDVFVEYAKAAEEDILIKITVHNRANEDAALHILPQLWFRNTWAWGYDDYKPRLTASDNGDVLIDHKAFGHLTLHLENEAPLLFCDNETNLEKLYRTANTTSFAKDGINEFLINGDDQAVNPDAYGTKVAANYDLAIKGKETATIRLRLCAGNQQPFADYENIFNSRIDEANEFYQSLQTNIATDEEKMIQRQALAGMLWSKQFYYYDVHQWLTGDPEQPEPPTLRMKGRNYEWQHMNNADIISMPDKWEYPWYAAWDLAFHCIPFALIDPEFAKGQLLLLAKDWYMHPNGQLPAYEWAFSDANPPVHVWAAWRVYKIDKKNNGKGDLPFLESVYHKLLLNFNW